ncbi:hypothetical protein [Halococcus sp. IIIV-5B]|uniref:hypothetical protein n=1 Tax=Halococcus sp. IIIV-5B TaxID=2321230 RepID=UPI001314D59B|nr:hypothetical protein [Halococcus sp. IIIV-5B]
MDDTRDPVERLLGESRDLVEVAAWDPRSRLDRLAIGIHRWLRRGRRVGVVALAAVILY